MKQHHKWFVIFILVAVISGSAVLIWNLQISHVRVQNEWSLEAGAARAFIAEDHTIQAIGLCADNVKRDVYNSYEPFLFSGRVSLVSGSEIVWEETVENMEIPVLSVQKQEGFLPEPVSIVPGQEYELFVKDSEGNDLNNITVTFFGSYRNLVLPYSIICTGILLSILVLFVLYYQAVHVPFAWMWVGGVLFVCLLESFAMVPPCVPDSDVHFFSTYAMSSEMMRLIPCLREEAGQVPTGILRMTSFGDQQYLYRFWTDWEYGNISMNRADDFFSVGLMPHYSYFIPALGVTLMRVLHAPWQFYIIAADLADVLLYSLITLLAIYINPAMKKMVIAITFLPSTMLLVNSMSYDVWNLAFLILAVCYCGRLSGKRTVRIQEALGAVLIMIAFIPVKVVYVNMALFLLILPVMEWRGRPVNRKLLAAGGTAALAACTGIIFLTRGTEIVSFLGNGGFDVRSGNSMESTYTAGWAVSHPLRTIAVYCATIYEYGPQLFVNTFLGDNFQDDIPGILAIGVIACFGVILDDTARILNPGRKERTIAGFTVISGIFIIMSSFLLLYSQKPETGIGRITGQQGRYFIPYLICLPYMIRAKGNSSRECDIREKVCGVCPYVLVFLTLVSILARFAGNVTT